MKNNIVNTAAYKFVSLSDLEPLREQLNEKLAQLDIMGTILLASEGINLMLAGEKAAIDEVKVFLSRYDEFKEMIYKDTLSQEIPFERFRIKIKSEIVPMGVDSVVPEKDTGPTISAQELKQWLDEERDFILLDTRNDYEIELGSFDVATHYNIHKFREFEDSIDALPESEKEKPIVMFCTGGVRCEKASPLMIEKGFKEVYQLEGGIIKYFQEVGGAHYKGDCFVFDHRTAITPACEETGLTQCEKCQEFVTPDDQLKTNYQRGEHCVHCMPATAAA